MPTDNQAPFEAALTGLLGPLAQAMVANGVTIGTANEALKKALLKAAIDVSETEINDSRASLMTGIHRKDVKRLRQLSSDETPRKNSNAAAMVISHWATNPDYQDKSGVPKDLPMKGNTRVSGFDDVVRQTRVDMAAGTVLQLLLDQGAVEILDNKSLRLLTHVFLPTAGSKEQVAAYQATLLPHMQAATHNLMADTQTPRHFDRAVRYSHLSNASLEQLRQISSTSAQELLLKINKLAKQLQDQDVDHSQNGNFAFGAYILSQPSNTEE